jgi:PAS domain S-box-containing protein
MIDQLKLLSLNLLESIPGHIYCKDKNGVYLWCNKEQLSAAGFTALSQVIGKTDFDMFEHDMAARLREVDLRIMNSGKAEILEEDGFLGEITTTLSYKAPLRDLTGEIIGIVGNSINITARQKFQRQLMSDHHYKTLALENIIANLPAHIYWKDKNGSVLGCNERQAQGLGFEKASDLIGKTDFDYMDKGVAAMLRQNNLKIMEEGRTEVIEESGTILGKHHVFLSHKAPLKDPNTGEVVGIMGVSIDITKQKAAEEAHRQRTEELVKALEVKERFLNNMDHEIRTPLQGIFGLLDALDDDKIWNTTPDSEKRSIFKTVLESRDRCMNVLSNLLDLSQLQKGREIIKLEFHDLKHVIASCVQEFQNLTSSITMDVEINVNTYLYCDDWRIGQVIRNLIANSIKHGGKDKPIQILLTQHRENDCEYLKIAVEDEGVGIPEDQLEEIFDPFTESSRTRRKSGGTGIGLAVCKELIAAHKGRMWAENNASGVGSTIFLILPYEKQCKRVYSYRLTQKS